MIGPAPAPNGYTRILLPGADVVALDAVAGAVRRAVAGGSLYAYAASHPARRELRGRGSTYAVPLPGGDTRVVVRHSRHGGLLAPVTGDRFLPPTRAPHELRTAIRLAEAGVATPEVIAYVTYRAGALFRRSDVATREVTGGKDLGELLASTHDADSTRTALDATARLLRDLERAGARHPDLNIANILIVTDTDGAHRALVLDVDRVEFGQPGDPSVGAANLQRLLRSARKQRARGAIIASDADLTYLAQSVGHSA